MANLQASPTAGLRGSGWNPDLLPSGTQVEVHRVNTADGAQATGVLYSRGGEKTVAFLMHPREMTLTFYAIPYLLEAGIACWSQGARTIGNDVRLEHELAIQDAAAGVTFLKERGYERVLSLGVSGGASLIAFYDQQAKLAPAERISRTPAGRPTKLELATMPLLDGFMFVSPHPGQGKLLLAEIDPSVTDERDARSIDQELFALSPRNGFARPPEGATYDAAFLERYRAGQLDRVARIDAFAKAAVAERQEARRRIKAGTATPLDRIVAAHQQVFTVWRTDADPRCFDLSLDPSDRTFGSLWGPDPFASNFGAVGFARVCTPESWLSTWSGITSNAAFDRTGSTIDQPVMMIEMTGDNSVFPSDLDGIFASIGSADKRRAKVRGNHHGAALSPGEPSGQEVALGILTNWIEERF